MLRTLKKRRKVSIDWDDLVLSYTISLWLAGNIWRIRPTAKQNSLHALFWTVCTSDTHTHLSTNLLHPMPLNLIFLMNIKFINLSHWFEELCRHNIIFYICLVLLLISMHYVCSKWHWITLHNEQTIHYIIIIKPKLYFMSPMVRTTGIRRYINSDKAKFWININSILESMGRK